MHLKAENEKFAERCIKIENLYQQQISKHDVEKTKLTQEIQSLSKEILEKAAKY